MTGSKQRSKRWTNLALQKPGVTSTSLSGPPKPDRFIQNFPTALRCDSGAFLDQTSMLIFICLCAKSRFEYTGVPAMGDSGNRLNR